MLCDVSVLSQVSFGSQCPSLPSCCTHPTLTAGSVCLSTSWLQLPGASLGEAGQLPEEQDLPGGFLHLQCLSGAGEMGQDGMGVGAR